MERRQGKQAGFTLVEIAIVLVIIGLLLGGILKGQEMITQAKIKNVIADFSGIAAAYHGYQDRYRAVPGDDPNATRWTGATVSAAADRGNGWVKGKYNSGDDTEESRLFWDHLRRAGFVSGTGFTQPVNATGGIVGVQTGNAAAPPAAALTSMFGMIVCSSNVADKIAIALDNQMDDGNATSGALRGQKQIAAGNPDISNTADTDNYAETGTNVYTVCRTF
jgi:prepilin-type N-terminal cleavage/methylation domain-containing protein